MEEICSLQSHIESSTVCCTIVAIMSYAHPTPTLDMAIVYPAAINRGKRLMKELHDVLKPVGIADKVIASLDTNYYPQSPWDTEPGFSDVVTDALDDANIGMSGWRFCLYVFARQDGASCLPICDEPICQEGERQKRPTRPVLVL